MELIQAYIDIKNPSPLTIRDKYFNYGYELGKVSNGEQEIPFAYKDLTFTVEREHSPIYSMGSPMPRMFARSNRNIQIKLHVAIDNNELYDLLTERGERPLYLETNEVITRVNVERVNMYTYSPYSDNDQFFAEITFVSTGEVEFLHPAGY